MGQEKQMEVETEDDGGVRGSEVRQERATHFAGRSKYRQEEADTSESLLVVFCSAGRQ